MLRRLRWFAVALPLAFLIVLELFRYYLLDQVLPPSSATIIATAIMLLGIAGFSLAVFRVLDELLVQIEERNNLLRGLHEAGVSLTAELSSDSVLQKVVDLSRNLVCAKYGALAVYDEGRLVHWITSGISPQLEERIGDPPEGRGLLGEVLSEGQPILVDDLGTDPRSVGFPQHHPHMTSFLGVPIVFKGDVYGNLYLSDKDGGEPFTSEDRDVVEMFATQAAIAIENARLYEQVQNMAVLRERGRIGREMHDSVAQVLGYMNTKTQTVQVLLAAGEIEKAQDQVEQLVETAQEAYADVRETILGLRTTVGEGRGLLSSLREFLHRYEDQSGLDAELVVETEWDSSVFGPDVELQLIRIIQEALTNVRKHAAAEEAWVRFGREDGEAVITIMDDGQGFDPQAVGGVDGFRFGLQTMRERAESVGGKFEIKSKPGRGTNVIVRLPLGEE